jgi:hypothetical protein
VVDLAKLDPAVTAQHLRKPEGEIGRALADSMAERNWPVYEAAIKLVGLRPAERLIEIGFGNGKLVPQLLALAASTTNRNRRRSTRSKRIEVFMKSVRLRFYLRQSSIARP